MEPHHGLQHSLHVSTTSSLWQPPHPPIGGGGGGGTTSAFSAVGSPTTTAFSMGVSPAFASSSEPSTPFFDGGVGGLLVTTGNNSTNTTTSKGPLSLSNRGCWSSRSSTPSPIPNTVMMMNTNVHHHNQSSATATFLHSSTATLPSLSPLLPSTTTKATANVVPPTTKASQQQQQPPIRRPSPFVPNTAIATALIITVVCVLTVTVTRPLGFVWSLATPPKPGIREFLGGNVYEELVAEAAERGGGGEVEDSSSDGPSSASASAFSALLTSTSSSHSSSNNNHGKKEKKNKCLVLVSLHNCKGPLNHDATEWANLDHFIRHGYITPNTSTRMFSSVEFLFMTSTAATHYDDQTIAPIDTEIISDSDDSPQPQPTIFDSSREPLLAGLQNVRIAVTPTMPSDLHMIMSLYPMIRDPSISRYVTMNTGCRGPLMPPATNSTTPTSPLSSKSAKKTMSSSGDDLNDLDNYYWVDVIGGQALPEHLARIGGVAMTPAAIEDAYRSLTDGKLTGPPPKTPIMTPTALSYQKKNQNSKRTDGEMKAITSASSSSADGSSSSSTTTSTNALIPYANYDKFIAGSHFSWERQAHFQSYFMSLPPLAFAAYFRQKVLQTKKGAVRLREVAIPENLNRWGFHAFILGDRMGFNRCKSVITYKRNPVARATCPLCHMFPKYGGVVFRGGNLSPSVFLAETEAITKRMYDAYMQRLAEAITAVTTTTTTAVADAHGGAGVIVTSTGNPTTTTTVLAEVSTTAKALLVDDTSATMDAATVSGTVAPNAAPATTRVAGDGEGMKKNSPEEPQQETRQQQRTIQQQQAVGGEQQQKPHNNINNNNKNNNIPLHHHYKKVIAHARAIDRIAQALGKYWCPKWAEQRSASIAYGLRLLDEARRKDK